MIQVECLKRHEVTTYHKVSVSWNIQWELKLLDYSIFTDHLLNHTIKLLSVFSQGLQAGLMRTTHIS
jgi:hypothetical protein